MRTLSIIDVNNEEIIFNPEWIVEIAPSWVYDSKDNKTKIPTWKILMNGGMILVFQSMYSLEDICMALDCESSMTVPLKESLNPEEEHQETAFQYPDTLKRYDFKYKKCRNYYDEAEDWVYGNEEDDPYESPCYYMDGNPLKATAMKIHPDMASLLLSTNEYDFDNPLRNLSWIEIDGHTALLFNNRAE